MEFILAALVGIFDLGFYLLFGYVGVGYFGHAGILLGFAALLFSVWWTKTALFTAPAYLQSAWERRIHKLFPSKKHTYRGAGH